MPHFARKEILTGLCQYTMNSDEHDKMNSRTALGRVRLKGSGFTKINLKPFWTHIFKLTLVIKGVPVDP